MLNPYEYLDISKNKIKAKHNCYVNINKTEFDETNITNTAEKLIIPGIFEVYFPEHEDFAPLVYNYDVSLLKTENYEETKEFIFIKYEPNDILINQEYTEKKDELDKLIKLFEGRNEYIKDPVILLNLMHDIFDDIDIVHYELIISNMARDAEDNNVKCRLKGNYNNCEILGQTKQAANDSLLSSLAYQNIKTAITKGVLEERSSKMNSLEKVINEDFS